MPFLRPPSFPNYLIFVGQCVSPPRYPDRYVAITIAGRFTLEEANLFIVEVVEGPLRPHFTFLRHSVQVRTMYFFAQQQDEVLTRISFYLNHYTTVDYMNPYDWQVARHDLDTKISEFVPPDTETAPLIAGHLIDRPSLRPRYG